MEKKKVDLGAAAAGVGKNAKAILGKAKDAVVKAADQNDDGSLNLKDMAVVAGNIGAAARNTADAVKKSAGERSREMERKQLCPIFPEDLTRPDFSMSKLIRVTEIDKRRAESEVCQGSIGFTDQQKGLRIVNIFRDKLSFFGLTFCPDASDEFYYVDPSGEDTYIALDDYFSYLKQARVNELQAVAQALGAKHFRVTYKEEKASFSSHIKKVKGNVNAAAGNINATAERNLAATALSAVEVAAEMDCPGHAPTMPKLHYLRRESCIQTLIALRMSENSPTHQIYTLKLSSSSGIKESDAVNIDAALRSMKIAGNATVTSEAQKEARCFFEYEIDF